MIKRLSVGTIFAIALGVAAAPTASWASCVSETCSIGPSSSERVQFGNGLPFPFPAAFQGTPPNGVTNTAFPNGTISKANGGARGAVVPFALNKTVVAGPGPQPSLMLPVGVLEWPGATTFMIPLINATVNVLSVQTRIPVTFPTAPATLAAGGRTGPPTVIFCPGGPTPGATAPPLCDPSNPGFLTDLSPAGFAAIMTYTATAGQFGGVAVPGAGPGVAFADVAVNLLPTVQNRTAVNAGACQTGGMLAPCVFARQLVNPGPAFETGDAFTASQFRLASNNTPGRFVAGSITPGGVIASTLGTTGMGLSFPGETATTFGGPWTTGRVSITAPGQIPPETFQIQGNDERTPSGEGTVNLVAGGIASRINTGPGANRGWLSLSVPEPGFAVALALGAAGLAVASTRRRA